MTTIKLKKTDIYIEKEYNNYDIMLNDKILLSCPFIYKIFFIKNKYFIFCMLHDSSEAIYIINKNDLHFLKKANNINFIFDYTNSHRNGIIYYPINDILLIIFQKKNYINVYDAYHVQNIFTIKHYNIIYRNGYILNNQNLSIIIMFLFNNHPLTFAYDFKQRQLNKRFTIKKLLIS